MSLSYLVESPIPGVRYLALRDLLNAPADEPDLLAARADAYEHGPIARVLAAMQPEGWWQKPGPGYGPKYKSSVWALILLAQLGASARHDPRIETACRYMIDHALASGGQFAYNGAPGGTFDCLQGNLCWALTALEYEDPRLASAFEWTARTVTGEGLAPAADKKNPQRYYAYKCGPLFACGANEKQPCGWGAVKVMLAFGALPVAQRTPLIERAVRAGLDFLLDNHPAQAGYPTGFNDHPNSSWFKLGFPVFYITDVLQIVEAAAALGAVNDPRLREAIELVRSKQDGEGRWKLEYAYGSKTYPGFGRQGEPSPWVTLRAMRALQDVN